MENTEEEKQMETGTAENTENTENTEEVKTKDEEVEETVTPAHPYQDELSQFQPHSWQLEEEEPVMYSSLDDTKFTMVDSQSLLDEMMVKLKEVTELAIDVEDHSYRSFHGMVCLLQISTRTEDFLIDPLILKDGLEVLNEVCTDSSILKVMHGSERDIKWLQKGFGIYVINMFDTQKAARRMINMFDTQGAARALKEKGVSLSNILKKYCKIDVINQYLRGDWRVRPLPEDMVKYAREDTHFLLYIHDVFRNSLLKKNALEDLYKVSTNSCGTVWNPNEYAFRPDSYKSCYRNKGKLNIQQLECFRLLYEWRHNISKEKDESTGYTLPNVLMLKISKALPREAQDIVNCCNPVPPLVEQNLEDIHKLILQAIINVPEVPRELVKTSKGPKTKGQVLLAIKNSKKKKTRSACLSCGRLGHLAKDCHDRNNAKRFGGPLRGVGAWNRGRGALFGAYPPGAPGMRGGPGFQRRWPRPMGPMHSYGHPPSRHPLGGNMYHSMDSYNAGPYNNGPFDPYNLCGAHPRFNAGGWW